jgi:propionyl-CoA carboxylase alpha chain
MAGAAAYAHAVLLGRAESVSGRVEPMKALRQDWVVLVGKKQFPIYLQFMMGDSEITFTDTGEKHAIATKWRPGFGLMELLFDNKSYALSVTSAEEGFIIRRLGVEAHVKVCTPFQAELHARLPEKQKPDTSKLIMSPMPGLVVSVAVTVGQEVKSGEAVCVVEAMKMQNIIRAEADGTVKAVNAAAGASVAADEVLVEFA